MSCQGSRSVGFPNDLAVRIICNFKLVGRPDLGGFLWGGLELPVCGASDLSASSSPPNQPGNPSPHAYLLALAFLTSLPRPFFTTSLPHPIHTPDVLEGAGLHPPCREHFIASGERLALEKSFKAVMSFGRAQSPPGTAHVIVWEWGDLGAPQGNEHGIV